MRVMSYHYDVSFFQCETVCQTALALSLLELHTYFTESEGSEEPYQESTS